MTEKEFRDFMNKIEKDSIKKTPEFTKKEKEMFEVAEKKNESENKAFLICGHELSSGVCCGLEMGHANDHEYITKADIDYEQKLRSGEINPDEAYELDKIADANSEFPPIPNTEPEPEGGFITKELSKEEIEENDKKILDEIIKKNKPKDLKKHMDENKHQYHHLNFTHNKKELAVAIGILVLVVGIGSFLLYDNYDSILIFMDDTYDDIVYEFTKSSGNEKVTPGEIQEETPLVINPTKTTDELIQQLSDNAFIVHSDGDWKATYLDGGNIPIDYFGNGDKIIIFDCWKDFDNVKHFFGVFQIINGKTLEVDLNVIGAHKSSSGQIGQGRSITWEGNCP